MTATTETDFIAVARSLGDDIRASADESERLRHLAPGIREKLLDARLFDLVIPRRYGGLEVEIETMVRVIEEVSYHDAAAGWCVGIGLGTSVISAFLPEATAREIFQPRAITGGPMAPKGRATPVDGGYSVTGRWPFASGAQHCSWLIGGSLVAEGGGIRTVARDVPDWRIMVFPAKDVEIIDTWSVLGLRGTGSHDMAVRDAFVPEERAISFTGQGPRETGTLYRFPTLGFLALTVAPVCTGIARRAIDEFVQLASTKTPTGARTSLKDRGVVQHDLGKAEAAHRAGRAYMFEAMRELWAHVDAGDEATLHQRAMMRLACAHAATTSAQAVDAAYELAGTTSLFDGHILQRLFRDAHAATQHIMLNAANYDTAGQSLLGITPDRLGL